MGEIQNYGLTPIPAIDGQTPLTIAQQVQQSRHQVVLDVSVERRVVGLEEEASEELQRPWEGGWGHGAASAARGRHQTVLQAGKLLRVL